MGVIVMLKVTDRFTTRDGEWFVSGKPNGITKEELEKYGGEDIPGKGAAHHIFVRVPADAFVVEFNTADGKNPAIYHKPGPLAGVAWINHPIFQGYNPDAGEVGPWLVRIDGEKVAEGIGLPYGWHVSTFLVVEEANVIVPQQPTAGDSYLVINGITVWRN